MTYITRSHRYRDQTCPRSRWWWTEYEGRGLEAAGEAYELSLGTITHEALAGLMRGRDLGEVCEEASAALAAVLCPNAETLPWTRLPGGRYRLSNPDDPVVRGWVEQIVLLEGMLRGFARVVQPRLLEHYEVVAVEEEFTLDLGDDLVLGTKPDLVLRRRFDQSLWYVEYKTTRDISARWFAQWPKAVQLMAGTKAIAESRGEPVEGCLIQALYKGQNRDGCLTSPLVYLWRKGQTAEVRPDRPTSWKGWAKEPVWESMGVEAWIETMAIEVLAGQFPQTPPIFLNQELIDAWLRQITHREREIALSRAYLADPQAQPELRQTILDQVFPQYFDQCESSWRSCVYRDLCWIPACAEAPLQSGFRWREFHHDRERVAWNARQEG